MITHNGTYLGAATHHGMPIYAATMGGKRVIGSKWLHEPAVVAIVAAFGSAEGTAVIAKTNDYLNRIATTDPQRALQISGFINEKPTIAPWVCGYYEPNASMYPIQLGLKFSKDFGYTFGATDTLEFSFIKLQSSTQWHDFLVARQAWNSSNAIGYIYNWSSNQLLVSTTSGSSQSSCLSPSMNQWYTVKQDMRSGIYVDNVLKISNKKSSIWVSDGALRTIADTQDRIAVNVISIYKDDVLIHRYYPIDDNGTWWDVIEAKFY